MKVSAFIATSLDGFIARNDGDITWLSTGESHGEDYGYKAFMQTVDVLAMGRHTYEKVLTFAEWPYGNTPVIVLSSTALAIPPSLSASVESLACAPVELVCRLAQRGVRHLYVDGGKTIQGFLQAGCLHQLIITRIPLLIGSGIPLFGPVSHDIRLRLINMRQFADGLLQSTYEICRDVQT